MDAKNGCQSENRLSLSCRSIENFPTVVSAFDCQAVIGTDLQKNDSVWLLRSKIHAFEPMESTYQALTQMRTWINVSTLYIHHLAVTNSTGKDNMMQMPGGYRMVWTELSRPRWKRSSVRSSNDNT